jgi:hypothetical protein
MWAPASHSAALKGLGFHSASVFSGRQGSDSERVHEAFELISERFIDHPVALYAALSFESMRHDIHSEMALAPAAVTGVSLVQVGFIHHFESIRRESLSQLLRDQIPRAHPSRIDVRRGRVNRGRTMHGRGCQGLNVGCGRAHTDRS